MPKVIPFPPLRLIEPPPDDERAHVEQVVREQWGEHARLERRPDGRWVIAFTIGQGETPIAAMHSADFSRLAGLFALAVDVRELERAAGLEEGKA